MDMGLSEVTPSGPQDGDMNFDISIWCFYFLFFDWYLALYFYAIILS